MDSSRYFEDVERATLPPLPLHLAIGMFDGVHLGHRRVIGNAVQTAQAQRGLSGVLTFWPHPSALFRPENPTKLILPARTKAQLLFSLGVDVVITQPFTGELAAIAADAFVPWLKRKLPALAAIYVGENFRFGRGRLGDVAMLETSGCRLDVRIFSAPRLQQDGEPISSTRIRVQLEAGEIAAANALLGYRYFTEGLVVPGKQLGRKLGFPTLNLEWEPELAPRHGVYAVQVTGAKAERALRGVANFGLRPTVDAATAPRLEVHLLDACPFDSGDLLRVEWLSFLRPELKFAGLDALRTQIAQDRAVAVKFFSQ
jgi:riboflavin kinase/FMN adenylyltransferase